MEYWPWLIGFNCAFIPEESKLIFLFWPLTWTLCHCVLSKWLLLCFRECELVNPVFQEGLRMPGALSASHVYSTPLALHNLLQEFFQGSSCAHCALQGPQHWTWTFPTYIEVSSVSMRGSFPALGWLLLLFTCFDLEVSFFFLHVADGPNWKQQWGDVRGVGDCAERFTRQWPQLWRPHGIMSQLPTLQITLTLNEGEFRSWYFF